MALKATHFTRQPPLDMLFYEQPYVTNCTSVFPPTNAFLESEAMKYSESQCKKSCLVQYVFEQCECFDPLLMDASRVTDYENTPFCPILRSDSRRQCANDATQGQLISKGLFNVIVWTKKPKEFFLRISALASKKRSDQKNKGPLSDYYSCSGRNLKRVRPSKTQNLLTLS